MCGVDVDKIIELLSLIIIDWHTTAGPINEDIAMMTTILTTNS